MMVACCDEPCYINAFMRKAKYVF